MGTKSLIVNKKVAHKKQKSLAHKSIIITFLICKPNAKQLRKNLSKIIYININLVLAPTQTNSAIMSVSFTRHSVWFTYLALNYSRNPQTSRCNILFLRKKVVPTAHVHFLIYRKPLIECVMPFFYTYWKHFFLYPII